MARGIAGISGALLAGLTFLGAAPPAIPQSAEVDLALVLAIDCSFSVDTGEFLLQMQGIGEALQNPQVAEAITKGPNQRIAITAYQWSDIDNQRVIMPWTVIDSAKAAHAAGAILLRSPRNIAEGGTAMSSALIYGASLMGGAPPTTRHVIDMSTDGRNNMGGPVNVARDAVVATGITINGLAITNEWPTLDLYLELQVTGGPGNFVVKANGYDDYGSAMTRKLIKEIVGPGLT